MNLSDLMNTMSVPRGGWNAVPGLIEPGNIPLYNRTLVTNNEDAPHGHSTVRSMSFQEVRGGPEILIPTVVNGRLLTEKQAIKHYTDTGEHMGKFVSPDAATAYAQQYHNDAAAQNYNSPNGLSLSNPMSLGSLMGRPNY